MGKSKKHNKTTKKSILITIICLCVSGYIIYNLSNLFIEVYEKKNEGKQLAVKLEDLKEKGETLKVEANKLNDPEYVAKYAREKYLYTKNNEYVIKIK